MVRYTGINHLAMVTGDMDATIRFWRDLLGMDLVAGLGGAHYRHYFFAISETDTIAFFEWDGVEPIPEKDHGVPVKGPVAFDHISLGVADEDALFELKAKLEAAGFWASEVVDHGFIHSLYSFDPNGIPIEFSYMIREEDPRRRPRMVDHNPAPGAMSGPYPQSSAWPAPDPLPQEERQVFPGEGEEYLDPQNNVWGREFFADEDS